MKRITIIAALLLCACTNDEHARQVLTSAGYTNIDMTGYDWFACSKDDWYHSGFAAKGPTGQIVSGVVCEGLIFKASTIRLN
jgi:hypothetical protein